MIFSSEHVEMCTTYSIPILQAVYEALDKKVTLV